MAVDNAGLDSQTQVLSVAGVKLGRLRQAIPEDCEGEKERR